MRVLVAYATRNGSTAEVAEAVAGTLRETGAEVALTPARAVRELPPVDAVVVGAPLYSGRWLSDARRFLKRHRRSLAPLPVAIFALGPLRPEPEAFEGPREQLDRAVGRFGDWLTPVAVTVFGGVDPPKKRERRDARDWDAIRAWAEHLPARFER